MITGLISFLSSDYLIHLAILFCIYSILAQGFNIVFGLGGLFNLGHIAFFAIGAYLSALTSTDYGWTLWSCIVCSTLLSGLFAILIGEISLVLSDEYFAIATLSFASIISALLTNWKSLTKGVLGIPGIPRPNFLGFDTFLPINYLFMAFSLCLLVQIFAYLFFRSKYARSLKLLAINPLAAQTLGRNPRTLKNLAFFISACFAGLAGSLFAFYLNFIDPSSFSLSEMVLVLTIIVVAKPGSFGGLFPALFVILLLIPEGLRFLEMPSSILGPLRQLINSLLLLIIVFIFQHSIFPKQREV